MSSTLITLAVAGSAFLISVLSPVVLRPWLVSLGVMDVASARSSHTGTVVRGLGISCVLAFVVVTIGASLMVGEIGRNPLAWILLLMGIACGLLGWIEDLRGVPIALRFAAQVLTGIFATWGMTASTGANAWFIAVGAVAVPTLVNATNFMDGVNGISGLYGLVAGGFFALAGAWFGQPWLTASGLIVAAAYVGFLPWNFGGFRWPASFMGDAGSYLLGGSLAAMALGAFFTGVPIETVMAPFLIYLADTGSTLARRIMEGKQWTQSHREHAYQRLTDVGFSHVGSAVTVIGFTILTCVFGAAGSAGNVRQLNQAAVATVVTLVLYLALPGLVSHVCSRRHTVHEAGHAGGVDGGAADGASHAHNDRRGS